MKKSILLLLMVLIPFTLLSSKDKDKKKDKGPWSSSNFSGLKLRSIGPAFTSGRIADFAVNPNDPTEYFVAAASGHIWKTTNDGDRKSTRLNSSHIPLSRMPSSA